MEPLARPLTGEFAEANVYSSTDRVVINVGGSRHECYISTIQNFPDTRLYWIAETALKMADFDPDGNEFFFDRHPGCFHNILNYCRTGKLHCPNDVCGPLFEEELAFWGVSELMMEPCCWGYYSQHREASKNLKYIDELYNGGQTACYKTHKHKKKTKRNYIANLRNQIWLLLEHPHDSLAAQIIALVTILMIVASMTTFCLETMPSFASSRKRFDDLEIFYCVFFTIDFVIRLLCCPCKKIYFKMVLTWIDFISTFQFYFGFVIQMDSFDFLSMLRLLRCFRLIRFFKDLTGMLVIGQTLKASARELLLLAMIFFVPMMIFSTMVFYAEKSINDDQFTSIPSSFWWAIITLSTVGYGDVVPKTFYGKLIGAACAYIGVLMVALPISVIGNNFSVYYSYAQARMRLPKRQENFLLSADKALLNNETSTKSSESLDRDEKGDTSDIEIDNPKRSRRYAIRNSFGPISNLQKNQRDFKNRKQISSKLPLITTETNGHRDTTSENNNKTNIVKNSVFASLTLAASIIPTTENERVENTERMTPELNISYMTKDSPYMESDPTYMETACPYMETNMNNLTPFKGNNERKQRSVTITNNKSVPISTIRNSKSISKSQDKIHNQGDTPTLKKRVLHLDISNYQPQKISYEKYEQRRKISQYHPAQSLKIDEVNFSMGDQQKELKQRKISTMMSGPHRNDMIVWLDQDNFQESCKSL